jgi:hypothetical protein
MIITYEMNTKKSNIIITYEMNTEKSNIIITYKDEHKEEQYDYYL